MFRSRLVRQAAERLRVRPRCFLRHQRIALVSLDTCEGASHGSRITSMANRHSDSYHPRDLVIRRAARISVTSNAQQPLQRNLNLSQKNHFGQKLQMWKMRRSASTFPDDRAEIAVARIEPSGPATSAALVQSALLVLRTVICLSCQTGREATKAERALPASVAPAGEVQRDGSTSPSLPVLRARRRNPDRAGKATHREVE